jgi:hypothetical protein
VNGVSYSLSDARQRPPLPDRAEEADELRDRLFRADGHFELSRAPRLGRLEYETIGRWDALAGSRRLTEAPFSDPFVLPPDTAQIADEQCS